MRHVSCRGPSSRPSSSRAPRRSSRWFATVSRSLHLRRNRAAAWCSREELLSSPDYASLRRASLGGRFASVARSAFRGCRKSPGDRLSRWWRAFWSIRSLRIWNTSNRDTRGNSSQGRAAISLGSDDGFAKAFNHREPPSLPSPPPLPDPPPPTRGGRGGGRGGQGGGTGPAFGGTPSPNLTRAPHAS